MIFEVAQWESISYLLLPSHIAPEFASLLGDEHSLLEHLISSKNVAFEPGYNPDCAVGTPGCLEEHHQEAKSHRDL